jgi:oligoribonuclease (3'-5' exoribonuclease)
MSGLDVHTCQLLEVACIVTDDHLNIVAEVPAVDMA